MKICCACGARPNFMKIAAVTKALRRYKELKPAIVHTGQHYDNHMFKVLFDDLGLPRPDYDLEVGSGSHAVQTARIIERFEALMLKEKYDLVIVVGDTNSTVACAMTAAKLRVPVAHVEAGLRSFDRSMPEEINRIVTDAVSDLLFVSEASGLENLKREGVHDKHVFFVGNVMIDTLLAHRERARQSDVLSRLKLKPREYAVLTLHRPSNVDDPSVFSRLLDGLQVIEEAMPIVFPVHPRTLARLKEHGLLRRMEGASGYRLVEPMGYLDFLRLMDCARIVLTDSGGIQEETTVLKVPCLTLRENTERPVTIEAGYNQLVGSDPDRIHEGFRRAMQAPANGGGTPEKWDGHAGERIARIIFEARNGEIPRR